MPNVSYVRDDVTAMLIRWNLIRDCISGARAVKSATNKWAGDKYLPIPNVSDETDANKKRFEQYVERAVFYNVTQRTLNGLVGQVFARDPIVKLGALMESLTVDIDGAGVSLEQQSKKALSEVVGFGRCGLLADYPDTAEPASREDLLNGNVRPTIVLYDPWDIINWRTKTVGAKVMLSLVVLAESYCLEDDGFELKRGKQWRVLTLDIDGNYRVGIWREENGVANEVTFFYPKDAQGNFLKEIKFTFIGAVNNDHNIDLPPLYDLSVLNVAHYRNSADYEEACFICGQPTPVLAGLTKNWVDEVLKGQVQLGSRAAVPLPEGGSATLLQAVANTMPFEAMEHKERQMVALGAKLVEQKQVQRTLGEAKIEEASEASTLATCALNVAAAYRKALKWAGEFIGDNTEPEFDLNTDFDIGRMDATERAQLIAEWQAGAIDFEEMRFNLKRANVAFKDDEEVKDAVEQELQSGMGPGAALMLTKAKQPTQDGNQNDGNQNDGNAGAGA